MKKIVIKIPNENKPCLLESKGLTAQDLMHILTTTVVSASVNLGITKRELLDAIKDYYEQAMIIEANK